MKIVEPKDATLKKIDHINCEEFYLKEAIKHLLLEHLPTDDEIPHEFEETWIRGYHLNKFGIFENNADISSEIYNRRIPFAFIDKKVWAGKSFHNRIVAFPISYIFDYFIG